MALEKNANKQKICGGLSVANGVISDMAGYAALETYGVVGMAAPTLTDGIAKLLPRARLRRGVTVKVADDNSIKIDLYIVVEYGVSLSEVSRMLAENVRFTLEDSAQLPVADVEVHVQGIKVRNQFLECRAAFRADLMAAFWSDLWAVLGTALKVALETALRKRAVFLGAVCGFSSTTSFSTTSF